MSNAKKKYKVFLFAPENEQLKALLAQHNNVRKAYYITPKICEPYMRVRVRQFSNGVVGIAKQFAASAGPIVEYSVGEDQGGKMVGTVRIPQVERFEEVVEIAKKFCEKKWGDDQFFFTCRVSRVSARTPKAHPWVEIFAVERREVTREVWQSAVRQLAEAIGGEAEFYSASVTEY